VGFPQLQPMFDSFQPLIVLVQPFVGVGNVRMQQGHVPAHAGDMFFERIDPNLDVGQVGLYQADVGSDGPQVFENQVFNIFRHGLSC
jgi:hypothetical protein